MNIELRKLSSIKFSASSPHLNDAVAPSNWLVAMGAAGGSQFPDRPLRLVVAVRAARRLVHLFDVREAKIGERVLARDPALLKSNIIDTLHT
jgi:hypothetical protein